MVQFEHEQVHSDHSVESETAKCRVKHYSCTIKLKLKDMQ